MSRANDLDVATKELKVYAIDAREIDAEEVVAEDLDCPKVYTSVVGGDLELLCGEDGNGSGDIVLQSGSALSLGCPFLTFAGGYNGVIAEGATGGNVRRHKLVQWDNDVFCVDGVSNYTIQLSASGNDYTTCVLQVPLQGVSANEQEQQQPFTIDLYVKATNANRAFSIQMVDNAVDKVGFTQGLHLKNIQDTAYGAGFGTTAKTASYGFSYTNSVERLGYAFSNQNVNSEIHLRLRIFGVQTGASSECELEYIADNGENWYGAYLT